MRRVEIAWPAKRSTGRNSTSPSDCPGTMARTSGLLSRGRGARAGQWLRGRDLGRRDIPPPRCDPAASARRPPGLPPPRRSDDVWRPGASARPTRASSRRLRDALTQAAWLHRRRACARRIADARVLLVLSKIVGLPAHDGDCCTVRAHVQAQNAKSVGPVLVRAIVCDRRCIRIRSAERGHRPGFFKFRRGIEVAGQGGLSGTGCLNAYGTLAEVGFPITVQTELFRSGKRRAN